MVSRFFKIITILGDKTRVRNTKRRIGTISFTTTGLLYSTTGMSDLSFAPTNGATSPQAISIDFSESTQFAGSSALKSFVQNGYPYEPDFHSKTLLK